METDQLHEEKQDQKQDDKQDLKDKAGDLAEHIGDLADTFYKLTVINITQKATNAFSSVLMVLALCTLGMFALIFGGIALAWWLGDLLDNRVAGFGAVAGFFALLTILIIALRKNIIFPYFRNLIIRKVYD
jgi:hypothetical protein